MDFLFPGSGSNDGFEHSICISIKAYTKNIRTLQLGIITMKNEKLKLIHHWLSQLVIRKTINVSTITVHYQTKLKNLITKPLI